MIVTSYEGDHSLEFYIPFDQFPSETEQFYPIVIVYQDSEIVLQRNFTDTVITVEQPPVVIHGISTEIGEESIIYNIELLINNYEDQSVPVFIWLYNETTDEYVKNPAALPDYRTETDSVLVWDSIRPWDTTVNYVDDQSVRLEMPFRQLPDGDYDFYPIVVVYAGDIIIGQRAFPDAVISTSDSVIEIPEVGSRIRRVDYQFEEAGLRLLLDFGVNGFEGQEIEIASWFRDSDTNELLANALQDESYSNADSQLVATTTFRACCEETNFNDFELYIPYNQFPAGTYHYYPQIQIVHEDTVLAVQDFADQPIEVLGNADPTGYIVELNVAEFSLNEDAGEVLLTYGIHEIDQDEVVIPGDQRYWLENIQAGETYTQGFEPVYLGVLATSDLAVDLELLSVVDAEGTQAYIESLVEANATSRRGFQLLLPRAVRTATEDAGSYVNGFVLLDEIASFFNEDAILQTESLTLSPDELLTIYQGEDGEFTSIVDVAGHMVTLTFRLEGYARHQAVE